MRKSSEYSEDERTVPRGFRGKYVFVYPFVKSREWYALPADERWRIMQGHIEVGREYPGVDNHTAYSFGLDDQEFVVAFDTDDVGTFLDLVQRLRTTEASRYTVRDTPSFTCIAMSLERALNALDGEPVALERCAAGRLAGERQGAAARSPRSPRKAVAHLRAATRCSRGSSTASGQLADAREADPIATTTTARSCARSSASSCRCCAARAIYGRLTARFGGRPPTPQEILADEPEELRAAAGLSRAKVGFLRSLAEHVLSGELELERLDELADEEVIAELVAVKGLGVWTAHMFLMFHLERPDVLPVGDLGIRRAIERAYGLDALPDAGGDGADRRAVAAATARSRAAICGARCRTSRADPSSAGSSGPYTATEWAPSWAPTLFGLTPL